MTPPKKLIREIHRRSIWQVLSIYLVGSWGALQVVEGVTENAGLPDWVPPFAVVLLVIGLPIVLATAFVQEGMPAAGRDREDGTTGDAAARASEDVASAGGHPLPLSAAVGSGFVPPGLLTWRNAIAGGVLAFALLGVLVAGYFLMRATGVGPVASLAAQGVIEAGEPVILAEFDNVSADPTLGDVVTEALRVDLASSRALTLLQPSRIADALTRMQRDPAEPLTRDLAVEVAIREGIKAVIVGEVGSAGSGYIFTAALHDPDTGSPLASFRRTAAGPDEVIAAIDGLSQDIREKAGESLRSIKAEEPLEAVTTSSLRALREYSEAETLGDMGEYARAKTLLEEAVALDPEFAMAWRKLAVVIQSTGGEPGEEQYAATRAFELRDRLTERERANAVAYYHDVVTGDQAAEMEAYENLLRRYPDDPRALNNLANAYSERTRHEEALELLVRAVNGPGESAPAHVNKVATHAYLGDMESAWGALEVMESRYPQRDTWNRWDRWFLTAVERDWSATHDIGDEMSRLPQIPPTWRHIGHWMMAVSDAAQGKLAEAEGHLEGAHERARTDGRHEDVILASDLVVTTLTDEERLGTRVQARLRSPSWQAVPVVARPYAEYVRMLTVAGELDLASELLEEWEAEVGESASFAQNEARLVLDARVVGREDPAAGADALTRFQQESNCPRCMRWVLAELSQRAGRFDRAAELYEDALVYTEQWSTTVLERPLAHERLGALYEELGDDARAAEHYARSAELWADADSDLQPRVRHARQRAEALAGAR